WAAHSRQGRGSVLGRGGLLGLARPLSVRGLRVLGRGALGLLGRGATRVLGLGGLGFGRTRGPRVRVSRRVRGIRRPHDADVGPCRRIRALLLRRGVRALDALGIGTRGIGTGTLGSGVGTLGVGPLGGVVAAISTRAAGARIAGVRAVGRPLVGGRPVGGRTAGIGAVSGLLVLHVELIDDHAAVARSLGGRVLLAGL